MGLDPRSLVHRADRSAEPLANGADVASLLEKTRCDRGLTLDQVAEETLICRDYLEAFEGRAAMDRLPPPPYSRYFLREYARYLGLAAEPLVESSPVATDDVEPIVDLLPLAGPTRRRWPKRALAAAGVGGVIALAVIRAAANGPATGSPSVLSPGGTAPTLAPSVVPSPRQVAGRASGVRAVLRTSAATWVQATADGRIVMQALVPSGLSRSFTAKRRLQLVLGDAGAVQLMVNGRSVPTGPSGQVVRLSFVLRGGRVATS